MGEVLDLGVAQGLIEKSGTWYSIDEERIGQGRRQSESWLKENAEKAVTVEAQIRQALLRPSGSDAEDLESTSTEDAAQNQ